MKNNDKVTNNSFSNRANDNCVHKNTTLTEVACVTSCLCPHDTCSGVYVDIAKTYLVKCICMCHGRKIAYKRTDRNGM